MTGVYEHYQLNYENSLSFAHVQKYLYKIICENLVGDQLYTTQLRKLKDQLLLVHFIENKELQPYLEILEITIKAINWGSAISAIVQELYKIICENLVGYQLYTTQLRKLKNQLLLVHLIKNKELQPYLEILEIIIETINWGSTVGATSQSLRKLVSLDCGEKWQTALQAAWDLAVIEPKKMEEYERNNLGRLYGTRLIVISNAAKILRREGCKIDCENGKVVIEESQARRIANQIEADIKSLGGIETLRRLFKKIEPCYQNKHGRYHLSPSHSSYFPRDYPVLFPVGYLLNLCVKHPHRSTLLAFESPDKNWCRILKNSIAFTHILDVRPYNLFVSGEHSREMLIPFLQNLAIYDNLFRPIQLRPSDVPKMIKGLFCDLSIKIEKKLGWTPEQAATIAERIFKLAADNANKLESIIFQSEKLYDSDDLELKIENNIIDKVLTLYSHKLNSVNLDFQIPQDISKVKSENYFQHKPLIRLSNNEYLLANSSMCSPAFYEAIISEVKEKVDGDIHGKLGAKTEDFIKDEFLARGIQCKSGYYGKPQKGYSRNEIDILVEASDTLIFFEVKKKTLTTRARSGNDFSLLIDLSQSLLASQIQINKHEIYIRKNEHIKLDNYSTCELKGRNIARVSVTLLDFGGFQDRTIIFDFLTNILNARLEVDGSENLSTEENEKLDDLKKKLSKFQEQFDELVQLEPTKKGQPFYDSWFLSLPQLLIILDNVNSSDDLKRELWKTRSSSAYFLDFYQEYYDAQKLFK